MSFDWLEYLVIAEQFVQLARTSPNRDALLRSSISRAYYAAFNVAREQLLAVLLHPEIPLHNNASELAARQRVRKRHPKGYPSFGPRSEAGALAWDVFQSLGATSPTGYPKLGVSFYRYIHSRLTKSDEIAPLASIIIQRATALNLSASWASL